jgi:hypothetical protein
VRAIARCVDYHRAIVFCEIQIQDARAGGEARGVQLEGADGDVGGADDGSFDIRAGEAAGCAGRVVLEGEGHGGGLGLDGHVGALGQWQAAFEDGLQVGDGRKPCFTWNELVPYHVPNTTCWGSVLLMGREGGRGGKVVLKYGFVW